MKTTFMALSLACLITVRFVFPTPSVYFFTGDGSGDPQLFRNVIGGTARSQLSTIPGSKTAFVVAENEEAAAILNGWEGKLYFFPFEGEALLVSDSVSAYHQFDITTGGTRLSFVGNNGVMVYDVETNETRLAAPKNDGWFEGAIWSTDEENIYASYTRPDYPIRGQSASTIVAIDGRTGALRDLFAPRITFSRIASFDVHAATSSIVFTAQTNGETGLFLYDYANDRMIRVQLPEGFIVSSWENPVAFSPDGAYFATVVRPEGGYRKKLSLFDATGSFVAHFSDDHAVMDFRWLTDGRGLYFSAARKTYAAILVGGQVRYVDDGWIMEQVGR